MRKMYTCENGIELLKRGYKAIVADKPTRNANIPIMINDVNLDFVNIAYVDGVGYMQIYNAKGHFLFAE